MNSNEVKFIADIGSNHNGYFQRCKNLILSAKDAGCWGIKLQLFKGDKLYLNATEDLENCLKERELPIEWLPGIKKICKDNNIKFGCSPFYIEAVDELKDYVDFLKISSFDIVRTNLIQKCIDTELPMMVSLGLIEDEREIRSILGIRDLVLFHCVSNYPTFPKQVNLINIKYLSHRFGFDVGWSDHTVQPGVIHQAVANGAKYIEFHLDGEDGNGWESHAGHCWDSYKIRNVIDTVKIMKVANGDDYGNDLFRKNKNITKRANGKTGLREYF